MASTLVRIRTDLKKLVESKRRVNETFSETLSRLIKPKPPVRAADLEIIRENLREAIGLMCEGDEPSSQVMWRVFESYFIQNPLISRKVARQLKTR